ncbi:uncharacterized protein LOC120170067 [Hibiscus syriacus]|uniref:uncharacterized protein LOC120170067 n=1 Tax=Hibiscus syriacus TaxID=106335 RepID=UPI001922278F|nr:uncharacterized protein LOC120170067 [Hibiscus syriacus]
MHWIKEGDKCSKFFHSAVAAKNKNDTIRVIVDDQGNRLEYFDAMADEVITFFSSLIGTADPRVKGSDPILLKELLQFSLPLESSSSLVKDVTTEEIKEAIFAKVMTKPLARMDSPLVFFKKSWFILGDDVVAAVKFFFHQSSLLLAFNATTIALVPKIPNPSKVKDFRPISCCSVVYKTITKILVKRLTSILPGMELVKGYRRKSISPRCSMKIDLQKAFDSFHWGFISIVLKALHLPNSIIGWIEACFTEARFSISFNGSLIGFFKGARGIRQGDPLSHILFVLAMNVLSRMLNMVVARENVESIVGVISVLDYFYEINLGIIKQIYGFNHGCLPLRYLGVPLVTRKLSEKDCEILIGKIKSRLLLRQLILPQSIINKIEQLCSRFFWKGSDKAACSARVSWAKIYQSKSEGELGLKNVKTWNKACMIKLIRNILAGEGSLWVVWLKTYILKENDLWLMEGGVNLSWCLNRILKLRTEALLTLSKGTLKIRDIWEEILVKGDKVPWHKLIWFPLHIPKQSMIAWMTLLDRLPTRDRLQRMGIATVGNCDICNEAMETRDHLFLVCPLASYLWEAILLLTGLKRTPLSWEDMLAWACGAWKGKSLLTTILKLAWCARIYALWEERNRRIFQGCSRSADDILIAIKEIVGIQLRGRNINRMDSVNINLCNLWGIV